MAFILLIQPSAAGPAPLPKQKTGIPKDAGAQTNKPIYSTLAESGHNRILDGCNLKSAFGEWDASDALLQGAVSDIERLAVRPGFEPGQRPPKGLVLPLHHRTNRNEISLLHRQAQRKT